MPALMQKQNKSVSIYRYHRGHGGEEIMPRSQNPAEHKDRKGAPTFLLSSSRELVAGLSSLLLLAQEGQRVRAATCI